MESCDLAFEYSGVKAKIVGAVDSVKNPRSGYIEADEIEIAAFHRAIDKR